MQKTDKILSQEKLAHLLDLATQAVPKSSHLRGQSEVALALKAKGYSTREIANFISNNGLHVSAAAVAKYLKNHPEK
jgi:predicted transcriptional regulator